MFKINIAEKTGKTYKIEAEATALLEKNLHDKVDGKDISPDLEGYEFEISGASDKSGFTVMKGVEGIGLKKVLLKYGKAMKRKPRKEGKKKSSNPKPKGLRLRKTVRGQVISPEITQINLKIIKEGNKKLSEIFPEQNKLPEQKPESTPVKEEPKQETPKEAPVEKPQETPTQEVKKEESVKKEVKPEETKEQ